MRAAAFLLLWSLALLSAQTVAAHSLKVAFDQEKALYIWSDGGQIKGLELDIVRAALAASGNSVVPLILPNRRVAAALTLGEADAITGVQPGDAGADAFYSDFYLTYADMAVTRTSKNIELHAIADILGYRVAAWQKAWQDLDLSRIRPEGPDPRTYTEFTSQIRQTKFFWARRADIDVVDRNIFTWYSRILAKEMNTSDQVTFHDIVGSFHVRAAFRRSTDRDAFNAGLRIVHANGQIGRIYARYGLIDPDKR